MITLLLGYSGLLSAASITLIQLVILLPLALNKNVLKSIKLKLTRPKHSQTSPLSFKRHEYLLIGSAVCLFTLWIVAGLITTPLDFDSHGYRLSRIGLWLQEHNIYQSETSDPRMNYSAFNGELIMLWLTAPFSTGYPLVQLAQSLGGLLLLAATLQFGRYFNFSRSTQITLSFLLLGMPVYVSHLMTSQVDLLFAGLAAKALVYFYISFKNNTSTLYAWLALSLAAGTKGTIFYCVPGLLLFALYLILSYRPNRQFIFQNIKIACITLALLTAPRYVENCFQYQNPFAPSEEMARLNKQEYSIEKLAINLKSYFLQTLTPDSNAPLFSNILLPIAEPLILSLPLEKDPYSASVERGPYFAGLAVGNFREIPSLMSSNGFISNFYALLGVVCLLIQTCTQGWNQRTGLLAMLIVFAALFVFLIALLFLWFPYIFRFFLTTIPVVCLCTGYFLESLPKSFQRINQTILMIFSISSSLWLFTQGTGTGWQNISGTQKTLISKVTNAHQDLIKNKIQPETKLAVSLPYYAALSSFFRSNKSFQTTIMSAEELNQYATLEDFFAQTNFDYVITGLNAYGNLLKKFDQYDWDQIQGQQSYHCFSFYSRTDAQSND